MASWCMMSSLIRRSKCCHVPELSASLRGGGQKGQVRLLDIHMVTRPASYIKLCRLFQTSQFALKGVSNHRQKEKKAALSMKNKNPDAQIVFIWQDMTIKELAKAMDKDVGHVFDVLDFIPGGEVYNKKSSVLDKHTLVKVIRKSGMLCEYKPKEKKEVVDKDLKRQAPPMPEVMVQRPPVVTIMGHVDHGKTTLLDRLRNSKIVDQEFGGITQHIGAFMVKLQSGQSICFLDTPGHAAFSAMRSRGAHLTDMIVLVVAADDGVMQQTQESIQHAKASQVPIIVAINKIDKNNADVERSKFMLMEQEIMLEEHGGDVQAVPISALKGTNVDQLQEAIITQAEMMDLKGDPKGLVEGRVVEARHDLRRGKLVTAVIQRGTLKKGDVLLAGTAFCKTKAMFDEFGKALTKVSPGMPVEIWGFKDLPNAGDEILQVASESEGKKVIAWRKSVELEKKAERDMGFIQEARQEQSNLHRKHLVAKREAGRYQMKDLERDQRYVEARQEATHPNFSFVLKGDVDGSVEAIIGTFDTYVDPKCHMNIIHFGVGAVTENDVEKAAIFGGEVYAFNVDVPIQVADKAKESGVIIRRHNIIYRLFEDLKKALKSQLPPLYIEVISGEAKVLQVFYYTLPNKKKATVAGCRVQKGTMVKKLGVKVMRDEELIYEGKMSSLKNFKVEVETIKNGSECGIILDDSDVDFKPHDIIISFELEEKEDDVEWNLGFVTSV